MTYFLVLWLSAGAVVMPQQYTLDECMTAGREARKDNLTFACVRAPK